MSDRFTKLKTGTTPGGNGYYFELEREMDGANTTSLYLVSAIGRKWLTRWVTAHLPADPLAYYGCVPQRLAELDLQLGAKADQMSKEHYSILRDMQELMYRASRTLDGPAYDEFLDELAADVEARIQARKEDGNPD